MTGVGLCLPQLGPHVTGPVVRDFCTRAEELGFTSLWVQEHLFHPLQPSSGYAGRAGNPVPAQYVSALAATELLTAAAAWTTSVTIGTSILVAGYHRPVELAQRLATIDVLSGGRLVVGLSLGWSADEHEQMDVPMDGRGARLEELIAALLACWGPDPVEHHGARFDIPPSDVRPKPVQQPRPLLISGLMGPLGRQRTPRLFDGWNPAGLPPDMAAEWLEPMNAARGDQPPLDLWYRTFTQRPSGTSDWVQMFAHVARAKELGFREVIIDANFSEEITSPQAWLDALERLAPAVR
jgi:probable F420-dependent oxidoreductase